MAVKILFKTLKIIIPPILVLSLIFVLRGGVDIIAGLFIFFPIIYISMGILSSDWKSELVPFAILTSCAFLIPVNVCFNMGTCIGYALAYIALSVIAYIIKRNIKSRRKKQA